MNRLFLLVVVTLFFAGCSTMYGRQNDAPNVFFEANVPDVEVTCAGQAITTPGNIPLRQSQSHSCVASKEGYQTQAVRVPSVISKKGFQHSTDMNNAKWGKWTLGLGTLMGWTVDFLSGAMRSLEEDKYVIEMKPDANVGTTKKVLGKTVDVTKTLVAMPGELVDETSTAVFDRTLRSGSESLGFASEEKRKQTESAIEGKKIVERLKAES